MLEGRPCCPDEVHGVHGEVEAVDNEQQLHQLVEKNRAPKPEHVPEERAKK
jgi:hypothetical protein